MQPVGLTNNFTKQLLNLEKAYIAGIIDGEGTISINRSFRRKYNIFKYACYIEVTNTNKDLLIYLEKVTQIGRIELGRKGNEKHKNAHVWRLNKNEIKGFLIQIQPYLIIKRKQCKLMLEWLNGNASKRYAGANRLPIEIEVERELIWEEMKELNRKGPNNLI